ncbi:MAG TPA: hypothetical protein VFV92_16670 [Candidatus Bathyarchaeia archaeon]|nr:hypothetical protein [Candidatus Bathyarchaeia archaeon]
MDQNQRKDPRSELRDNTTGQSQRTTLSRHNGDRAKESAPRRRYIAGMRTGKLAIPEEQLDPNYHYHWINDDPPGRLEEFQYDGYVFVTRDEIQLIAGTTPSNTDDGNRVSRIVSREGSQGTPVKAYLMKMPMDIYEDRMDQLQEPCNMVDEAIRRGKMAVGDDENFYRPKGAKNKIERD